MKQVKNRNCFAAGYSFYKMFWIFLIFSVLGTLMEGIFWVFRYGHFEIRSGLIYGPFSEIYGFAVVILTLLLHRFKNKNILFLFSATYAICVFFELFCSLFQEWAFGFRSWNYSASEFTLFGRANLIFCLFWGLFGVIFIKYLYPKLSDQIEKIPNKIGLVITWLLLVFIIFDFSVSAAAVYRLDQRQNNIPASNFIQVELDKYYPDPYLENIFKGIINGRTM